MKLMIALTGMVLAVCPAAVAQETGERVVVPARNSTRPRKVEVKTMQGDITVKTHAGKDVIVETTGRSGRREAPAQSGGMHRIDLPPRGISVEEEDNVITVKAPLSGAGHLMITVPADTSLAAKTQNGAINADGLTGEIDVSASNGRINLTNVSGAVVAHSLNGAITVTMNRVDASKPLSFSTLNGAIDVTLPADVKANVKLNTHHGEVWSDFDIKLGGGVVTQSNNTADGKFRVTSDRNMVGTISNGGGAEASFYTLNGKITIRKK